MTDLLTLADAEIVYLKEKLAHAEAERDRHKEEFEAEHAMRLEDLEDQAKWQYRAEDAEARIAALEAALREPTEAMVDAAAVCWQTVVTSPIWKPRNDDRPWLLITMETTLRAAGRAALDAELMAHAPTDLAALLQLVREAVKLADDQLADGPFGPDVREAELRKRWRAWLAAVEGK